MPGVHCLVKFTTAPLLVLLVCRRCALATRNAPVVETVPRLGRSLILYLIVPNWRMSETTSQKLEIILPETRSIIIRVMMASFKFVERGVFGPDHPPKYPPRRHGLAAAPPPGFPGARLQLLHSKHFLNIPGNHHASVTVRNLEDVGGSDFKLDPDSERSIEC